MPGSTTSVFSVRADFEAALREEGVLSLLVTGRGGFQARLTRAVLHRLRLSAAEEQLARIAFQRSLKRKNMLAANYVHIRSLENRLGRHYSQFLRFLPAASVVLQSLVPRKSRDGRSKRRS